MSLRSKPKPEYIERPDGRIELRGTLYTRMKRMLCELAGEECENCGRHTPLESGDPHHDTLKGMGGARRDDRIYISEDGKRVRQLYWYCRRCHDGKHVPAKVVPEKPSDAELREILGL